MDVRVVLSLLLLVRKWNFAKADCSKKLCSNSTRVTFEEIDRKCAKVKIAANHQQLNKVVDGQEAEAHEFPFMVRLSVYYSTHKDAENYKDCNKNGWVSYDDTKSKCCNNTILESYRCGGSILNKDWVLSAKHCFQKTQIDNNVLLYLVGVLVYAGDHKISIDEAEQTLHWVTTNKIKEELNNDVALLEVNTYIMLDEDFRYPICLPPSYMNELPFLDGCAVEAAGWGRTKTGSGSDILIKGDFTVVQNTDCKEKYAEENTIITDNMICTDDNKTVTCLGDSGGPVFFKSWRNHFYQVGIISFGQPKTVNPLVWDNEFPEVNVRVTKFVAWIKGIVGAENLP